MREFSRLYAELDGTTSTSRKLAALQQYFAHANPDDAAWAVYFLAGGKPRQAVPSKWLRHCAMQYAQIDEWLFDECYDTVGDLAETIAHILPPAPPPATPHPELGLAVWVTERIAPLRGAAPEDIRIGLFRAWDELDWQGRFLHAKLIGGSLRVGVSKLLVTRALAAVAGLDPKLLAQRLVGWTDNRARPDAARLQALLAPDGGEGQRRLGGQPYPFFLAHALLDDPRTLGPLSHWQVEWKYDGIRAQLVRRDGVNWLWSRGEELISERFPELAALALPEGVVLDGEIVIREAGVDAAERPASFALLQKRIGRSKLSAALLAELPAALIAYDLLELDGRDLRQRPQAERRVLLEQLLAEHGNASLLLAPQIAATDWDALAALRAQSRQRGVEGMMLKAADAHYGVGRTRDVGVWWKWKIDPYSIDAVLIYAQSGHGRRAQLYTDYTFAVWDDSPDDSGTQRRLVPFAKAYSGLTDAEIAQVDRIIRNSTIEKFGPVRSVRPSLVFEIGFEGIAASTRHKAGVAVRFPRILRMRPDKSVDQADTLEALRAMLAARTPGGERGQS
ncbi:ATP-dependent DNA ligase [Herbaspirillum sp. YR522]|uniref:ATP-dependent DNA ligase n=1 Tax=Herbaspirillum sp. YR522 TaxID=1144342 RepID=UPI00026FA283|nr:ATP-dependent DNA ligase [Herbaspirillum sp. YR522]EJN06657.1 DNA ligase, ATP-dependent, PP_1105 family [Herbaspirillum sp. YR522]